MPLEFFREGVNPNKSENLPYSLLNKLSEEKWLFAMMENYLFQNVIFKFKIFIVSDGNKIFASLSLIFLIALLGCDSGKKGKSYATESQTSSNEDFVKTEIHHAKGFTIEYHNHYKVVKIISPFENSADTTKYILVSRGKASPEIFGKSVVIEIPVRSLAATSSMHIGLLKFLDSESVLTGLSSLQYVYSTEVIKMIGEGKVTEVGKEQGINEEKLVALHPDLVMTTGSPTSKMQHYRTLSDAGIPVINNAEWVEETPLARAEWVKLAAALLNKEELVNKKFEKIETQYTKLVNLAKQAEDEPVILSGLNMKDVWYVPNGNSYMARFFRDAGGNYPWEAGSEPGSLPLRFESVYPTALKADIWVNVGFNAKDTKKTIGSIDNRYRDFKAFKTGKIFSYNNRVNERGTNDFFESGNVEPHLVLSDLIKIFHPELLPDHQLVYYKQLL